MSSEDVKTSEQLANYSLSDDSIVAPDEFDPDRKASFKPSPGWHEMIVKDFTVEINHDTPHKKGNQVLHQLRPFLTVASDQPEAGASLMDFLPMPSKGTVMLPHFANQWGNFIKGCGFELPVDQNTGKKLLVPKGFKMGDLLGKRVRVKIEAKTDREGQPVLFRGEPDMEVAYFGYLSMSEKVPTPREKKDHADTSKDTGTEGKAKNKAKPAKIEL